MKISTGLARVVLSQPFFGSLEALEGQLIIVLNALTSLPP